MAGGARKFIKLRVGIMVNDNQLGRTGRSRMYKWLWKHIIAVECAFSAINCGAVGCLVALLTDDEDPSLRLNFVANRAHDQRS